MKVKFFKEKESLVKFLITVSLIVLLAISVFVLIKGWIGGHYDSAESFKSYIESFGIWGPIVLTLIQLLQVVLPVLPGFLGCIVGGAIYGPFVGFLINYIGISAGSIIAYYLAKIYGVKLVDKMINLEKYQKYIDKISKSKSYSITLFVAILLPLAPDDFMCYFSGLINMSAKKFNWIIITAKPWCILFYSIFFAYYL